MKNALRGLPILVVLIACSCGGAWSAEPPPTKEPLDPGQPGAAEATVGPDETGAPSKGGQPGQSAGAKSKDAPEISRSGGEQGGLVVFWPRVIPRTDDPAIRKLAGELQGQLVTLAKKAAPGRKLDVRPEPERVCPRAGCAAMTLGVLLVHTGGGCTALGLVSGAGTGEQHIVPWAGVVKLTQDRIPFRDHPENQVTVRDAVPCKALVAKLAEAESDIVKAVGEAIKR